MRKIEAANHRPDDRQLAAEKEKEDGGKGGIMLASGAEEMSGP